MLSNARFPVKAIWGHAIFWLAYIYYQGIIYHWQDTDELRFALSFHTGSIPIVITILLTYFNLYVLLPLFYYRQKFTRYAIAIVASLLLGATLTRVLTHLLILPWEQLHEPGRYLKEVKRFWIPSRILRLAIQYYPVIAMVTVFELMRKLYEREKLLRATENERSVAEMRCLKAQINPHFFFNTLNSLYALIMQRSEEAGKLVLRLSTLMRYMLDKAKVDYVDLKAEIVELENYLRIEQLRFADRLDLSFQTSGITAGLQIMPLTLLPFAENAFKHGVEEGNTWVTIDIKITGKQFFYNVRNGKRHHIKPENSTGIGLSNLRRRLELAYPGKYTLIINEEADVFDAALKINL